MHQQSSAFEPAPTTEPVPAPPATPEPVTPARPAARPRSGRILNAALGLAVALAIGGVAFAAGRLTAPAAAAGAFPNGGPGQFFGNGNGNGNGGNRGNAQGAAGGFLPGGGVTLEGTVESVTDTTLTLKTASGQTIQIALNGTTTYHAQSDARASDVTTGKTVLVRLDGRGGFRGGPQSTAGTGSGTASSATASDVTVVP